MKKYLLFTLCALGGIFLFFFIFRCNRITCIKTDHLSIVKVKEIYESTHHTFRALYITTNGLFRVEKQSSLSDTDAEILTKANIMTIQGLFENARSPYPGPLSDEIICDNKFKSEPTIYTTSSTTLTTLISYANNRLQYGSCLDDQILYKSYIALFYCKNHDSWYKAELLIPIAEALDDATFLEQLHAIQCR